MNNSLALFTKKKSKSKISSFYFWKWVNTLT